MLSRAFGPMQARHTTKRLRLVFDGAASARVVATDRKPLNRIDEVVADGRFWPEMPPPEDAASAFEIEVAQGDFVIAHSAFVLVGRRPIDVRLQTGLPPLFL